MTVLSLQKKSRKSHADSCDSFLVFRYWCFTDLKRLQMNLKILPKKRQEKLVAAESTAWVMRVGPNHRFQEFFIICIMLVFVYHMFRTMQNTLWSTGWCLFHLIFIISFGIVCVTVKLIIFNSSPLCNTYPHQAYNVCNKIKMKEEKTIKKKKKRKGKCLTPTAVRQTITNIKCNMEFVTSILWIALKSFWIHFS